MARERTPDDELGLRQSSSARRAGPGGRGRRDPVPTDEPAQAGSGPYGLVLIRLVGRSGADDAGVLPPAVARRLRRVLRASDRVEEESSGLYLLVGEPISHSGLRQLAERMLQEARRAIGPELAPQLRAWAAPAHGDGDALGVTLGRIADDEHSGAEHDGVQMVLGERRASPSRGPGAHASQAPSAFVGRRAELQLLHDAWDAVRDGAPAVVLVHGTPGSGKTWLVRQFLHEATVERLLGAAGDPDESRLAWSTLHQMASRASPSLGKLGEGLRSLLGRLDAAADPMLVASALLEVVDQSEGPLAIVIDDAQWADDASLSALRFVLRRLGADPVLCVLVVRGDGGPLASEPWRRALDALGTRRVHVGALSVEDVAELSRQLGHGALTGASASRLHRHTGGHALYTRRLLEQVRSSTLEGPDGALPVPHDIGRAVIASLGACSEPTRRLIRVAAVLGLRSSVSELEAVLARLGETTPPPPELVEEASRVDILSLVGGPDGEQAVEFSHELVRAAIYEDLGEERRTALHRAAAEVLEESAALRHRIAASHGTDESLAAALSGLGQAELASGSFAAAATLLRQAQRLSEPGRAAERRLLLLAEALLGGGRVEEALALEGDVQALLPSAWRDYVLGYLRLLCGRHADARALLEAAHRAVAQGETDLGSPPDLAAKVACQLGIVGVVQLEPDLLRRHGFDNPERRSDPSVVTQPTRSLAHFVHAVSLVLGGAGDERALRAAEEAAATGTADGLVARGLVRLWTDDVTGAHEDLEQALGRARQGEALIVSQAAGFAAEAKLRLGRLAEASTLADLAVRDAEEAGRVWDLPMLHAQAGMVHVAQADWVDAEAHARAAEEWAALVGTRVAEAYATGVRALLASAGTETASFVAHAAAFDDRAEVVDPGCHTLGPILADALRRSGDLAGAEAALQRFSERASRLGRRSALALAARSQGYLHLAQGRTDEAAASFERAIRELDSLRLPLEAARARIGLARAHHARHERAAAIGELRAVRRMTEAAGANALSIALDELLHSWGEGPVPTPDPSTALTPTEAAVARLVSEGLSNREVAHRLCMSSKTVEYHLTHVYAKLGVRSRRGLRDQLLAGAE